MLCIVDFNHALAPEYFVDNRYPGYYRYLAGRYPALIYIFVKKLKLMPLIYIFVKKLKLMPLKVYHNLLRSYVPKFCITNLESMLFACVTKNPNKIN